MMKTAAICVAVSLAAWSSASAGTKPSAPPPTPAPSCVSLDTLKADLKDVKGAKFTPLNIAQYHLMLGAYAATPPIGLPADTDNALLVQLKNKNMIVWMKAECASKTPPMPISEQFVAILRTIHPVAGETSDADDSKDELHL